MLKGSFAGDTSADDLAMEHALAGWAAMPIQPSPMPSSAWAMAIRPPPPEAAEQHHALAPRRFISSYTVFTSTMLVEAVGVVVLVAGAEGARRSRGGSQQRAGSGR
ncbi:MAG: hypothetical protein R2694_16165 [Ilumatobacteraceae bacterium]